MRAAHPSIFNYELSKTKFVMSAKRKTTDDNGDTMILPFISENSERIKVHSQNKIEILKRNASVFIEVNVPMVSKTEPNRRIFNQVPGMEAFPVLIPFPKGVNEITCITSVI